MSPLIFFEKFCVGFSYGTPFPLTIVILDYWLKECGVSNSIIGFFTILHLPFTLKFIWAPLMENTDVPYLSKLLGRTKSWVILSQIVLIIGTIGMAHANPESSLGTLMFFASLVAFADGCQNIALYPYQIDEVSAEEFGYTAGIVSFGHRLGSIFTKFVTLQMAHFFGWTAAYECAAVLISICMLLILLTSPPVTRSAAMPSDSDYSIFPHLKQIILEFLRRKDGYYLLGILTLYKAADYLIQKMSRPFCLEIGFSKEEIAIIVQLVGAISMVIGGFIGGFYVKKVGLRKAMLYLGIAHMLSLYFYVGLYIYGHNTNVLRVVVCLEGVTEGATAAAFLAFLYTLCSGSSQYALLWALHEFVGLALASISGALVDAIGWLSYFLLIPFAFLPSMLLLCTSAGINFGYNARCNNSAQ
ncbi:MAG: MFS transporter [Holosporaceae bacterium]|jgi:PAT family beta-lactamase induction signal transducer AmpG|nr:MFS transporter [Holosporaceae bacterium]